jgi:hypothetical protein
MQLFRHQPFFNAPPMGCWGAMSSGVEKHGALSDSMLASVVSKPSIEAHGLIEVRGKIIDTNGHGSVPPREMKRLFHRNLLEV